MHATRFSAAIGLVLAAFLAFTACGSTSSRPATAPGPSSTAARTTTELLTPTAAAFTSRAAPGATTGATSPTGAQDTTSAESADESSCPDATVEVNKAINAMPEGQFVVDVEIEGACTVSLKTGYTHDNVASALKLCQAAEPAADANGARGVSVVGNGVELASGTTSSPCAVMA